MHGGLYSFERRAGGRESVENILSIHIPDIDRKAIGHERALLARLWIQPAHDVAADFERYTQRLEDLRSPRTGSEHKAAGLVEPAGRLHFDAVTMSAPAFDAFLKVQFRTGAGGEIQMGTNRFFRPNKPGAVFEHSCLIRARPQGREALGDLARGEHFIRKAVLDGAADRAFHNRTAWIADHQAACDLQQRTAGIALQLFPKLVGTLNQRHVRRVFVIGLPDDTRVTMRGAPVVRGSELLQAKDAQTAPGQMIRGSTAHTAETDHDCVESHASVVANGARRASETRAVDNTPVGSRTIELLTVHMSEDKTEVPYGTLDLLILKTLDTMGPMHGYRIARRIEQVAENLLRLNQGSIYPALLRLEQQGYIRTAWGVSETKRKVKFYSLTKAGSKHLSIAVANWERATALVARFLAAET
jgi:PadR family transcriptional regulator, regulatory protein PadR